MRERPRMVEKALHPLRTREERSTFFMTFDGVLEDLVDTEFSQTGEAPWWFSSSRRFFSRRLVISSAGTGLLK